jgi:hypothetical protein
LSEEFWHVCFSALKCWGIYSILLVQISLLYWHKVEWKSIGKIFPSICCKFTKKSWLFVKLSLCFRRKIKYTSISNHIWVWYLKKVKYSYNFIIIVSIMVTFFLIYNQMFLLWECKPCIEELHRIKQCSNILLQNNTVMKTSNIYWLLINYRPLKDIMSFSYILKCVLFPCAPPSIFGDTGVQTQGFVLSRQALYHFRHTFSLSFPLRSVDQGTKQC